MKTAYIAIVLCLLAYGQTADIDRILYQKVEASIPNVDDAAFNNLGQNTIKLGKSYSYRVHESNVSAYVEKTCNAHIALMIRKTTPFSDFGALKWGTKLEHLESIKVIAAGGVSWGIVTAAIGTKSSDGMIDLRAVNGWAFTKTTQPTNSVRVHECKTKFFKKKCSWTTKNIPRGLTTAETNTLH